MTDFRFPSLSEGHPRPAGRRAGARAAAAAAALLLCLACGLFGSCGHASQDGVTTDAAPGTSSPPQSSAAGNGAGPGSGTSPEPETEAVSTAVTSAETTLSVTAVVSDSEASSPTPNNAVLNILRSMYARDSLSGNESDGEIRRNAFLESEYGITVSEALTDSLPDTVKALCLAGSADYDLVIPSLNGEAARLITEGLLADLSLHSLNLADIASGLSSELAFGSRQYLLFCDAVVSDIFAAPALDITDAGIAAEALRKLSDDGGLTFALLTEQLSAAGLYADIGAADAVSLLEAAGGSIFIRGENSLPAVNLRSAGFATAYGAVLPLCSSAKSDGAVRVSFFSLDTESRTLIPLPRLSPDSPEITPLRLSLCSAIAAPVTSLYNPALSEYLTAVSLASSPVRADAVALAEKGPEGRSQTVGRILSSMTADAGLIFDWGDFSAFVSAHLADGDGIDALLSDRLLPIKEKAAAQAAAIISERLG